MITDVGSLISTILSFIYKPHLLLVAGSKVTVRNPVHGRVTMNGETAFIHGLFHLFAKYVNKPSLFRSNDVTLYVVQDLTEYILMVHKVDAVYDITTPCAPGLRGRRCLAHNPGSQT
jgi:hypothetical protein